MKLTFKCTNVEQPREFPGTEVVTLALISGEGLQLHSAVPQGQFTARITNPEALGSFELNQEYEALFDKRGYMESLAPEPVNEDYEPLKISEDEMKVENLLADQKANPRKGFIKRLAKLFAK